MSMESLAAAIKERRVILFVGGGISQSLGLPDFRELISHICRELNLDPSRYHLRDYPVLAESYVLAHGKIGKLRSWMDTRWHTSSIDVRSSEIHNLILQLDFPVIYTTNYDRWMERAYSEADKPCRKIISVRDLAGPDCGETLIIKFHGDFDDDDSIVLTESSYFHRMSFETPLDLRLRSDSLARPVLFLGYSLHDVNTRYLFFKLRQLWESSPYRDQRPSSYILMTRSDRPQEAVLNRRGVEALVWEDTDPGKATMDFLRKLVEMVKS